MNEVTGEKLKGQLVDAVRSAAKRTMEHPDFEGLPPETMALLCQVACQEYLTGAGQAADFLTRNEGQIYPQQIARACREAGQELGMEHSPGKAGQAG